MRPRLIEDPIYHSLNSRLLGSNCFESNDSILNDLLSLHHRVYYHIHQNLNTRDNALNALRTELGSIGPLEQDLHIAISDNISGIVRVILDEQNDVNPFPRRLPELIDYPNFGMMLQWERIYYNRGFDSTPVFDDNVIIPSRSDALTWHYLEQIAQELDFSNLNPSSPFQWLLRILAGSVSDAELLAYGRQLLKKCTFPNADESNSQELEQFHIALHQYFKRSDKANKEWENFLVESIQKTFQSIPVTKTCMLYYGAIDQKRSILNFRNFIKYSDKYFELNNRHYDLFDLIAAHQFILSLKPSDYEPYFVTSIVSKQFLSILEAFHTSYKIPLLTRENCVEFNSNKSILSLASPLALLLSKSWQSLFENEGQKLSSFLDHTQLYFISNAIQALPDVAISLKFEFAYQLAMRRQIDQCILFLKKSILNSNPENFASWHLLALCESCINEDLQVSFKIVNSVIQSMCDLFDEGNQFSISEKWHFIHLKLTQIQLVKEMFAHEDALEMLPEVFELYNQLFENGSKPLGPHYNQSNEYLLQSIWLFALELYLDSADLENAHASLEEFKKVTSKFFNLNHTLARGYVLLETNERAEALKEFEKVLHFDPLSVDATLGFAKVALPNDELTLENELKHLSDRQDTETKKSSVNVIEKSAALSRLKFMLENLVGNSIEGYHSPAVWWYLAKVYEEYADSKRQEHALWQCVKYEELEPVRDFKFSKF